MTHVTRLRALTTGLLVALVLAAWGTDARSQKRTTPKRTPVNVLGGEERYRVHVSTDKPIYRLGEKVYVRGVILEAHRHTPLTDFAVRGQVQILGPKGETIASGNVNSADSVIGYAWQIADGLAGGEYTIKMSFPWLGLPAAERKFDIRAYRPPRLKSQIVFVRDGYGPGDTVQARLHTERAEGGIPAGAKVTSIARVDGNEVYRGSTTIDDEGNCSTSFELPKAIERGEGSLAMVIEDGGVVETASKTIPILLQTLDLVMFPEGGDLVTGLESRVYVEAKTPSQKPADLEAVVKDDQGNEVVRFVTEHEGRGRFGITPKAGRTYHLEIVKPSGIATKYPLPAAKESGVVLGATENLTARGRQIRLRIGSTDPGQLLVSVSKQEMDLASAPVTFTKRKQKGTAKIGTVAVRGFVIPREIDGVLVATVWNEDGLPVAERLVFRQPSANLLVSIETGKKSHVPGGDVELTLKTTDERGKAVSGVVGVTVTDESVLEMIEKREQAPRLPVMVFFEDEVKELSDAHVYLDPKNPKAPVAVDLLLGTQGWRRFAYVDTPSFVRKHGQDAQRAVALSTRDIKQMREQKRQQEIAARKAAKRRAKQMRDYRNRRSRGVGALGGAGTGRGAGGVARGGKSRSSVARRKSAPPPSRPGRPRPMPEPEASMEAMDEAEPPMMAPVPSAAAPEASAPARVASKLASKPKPKPKVAAAAARPPEQAAVAMAEAMAGARDEEVGGRLLRPASKKRRVPNAMTYIREYAHQVRAGRKQGDRVDFTETVYWTAAVKTDGRGVAKVKFSLSDSVTAFRVMADAFDAKGRLGSGTSDVKSVEPFYIEPKVPLQVTSGDVIRLPVAVVNSMTAKLGQGQLKATAAAGIKIDGTGPLSIGAGKRERHILEIAVGDYVGTSPLVIEAHAGGLSDKVTKTLDVQPLGFPISVAAGGMLEAGATETVTIDIPQAVVKGSFTAEVVVYPTPLANLTQALARLMREPRGCFEQTSSSNYPLVMAQQYFMSHTGVDPAMIEKSRGLLDRGYKRLRTFECKEKGYEWFGQDPGHEALSAYGLMEFADMSKVMQVDTAMLDTTREWLLARRDGKGRFTHARRALHTWIIDPECHTSYITWALLESGEKRLDTETRMVKDMAASTKNSYVTALGANVAVLAGDRRVAKNLMKMLVAKQNAEGWVDGATTSIVGSRGESLKIETTALAVLAWIREKEFAGAVEKGIRYLTKSCEGGRYGSTQATVLALRAIVEYDKTRSKPKKGGSIQLLLDGKRVGGQLKFTQDTQGAITLPGLAGALRAGKRAVALKMTGGASMPYSVAVQYNTLQPASSPESRVFLRAVLKNRKLTEGGITEIDVQVFNTTDDPVPTPVALIGVPGGLEVRHDQLKELKKAKRIAAYEVIGRDVVLYWRELAPRQKITLPISLVAAVPGTYTGAASRAYEYYADEFKQWAPGLKVEITPKR